MTKYRRRDIVQCGGGVGNPMQYNTNNEDSQSYYGASEEPRITYQVKKYEEESDGSVSDESNKDDNSDDLSDVSDDEDLDTGPEDPWSPLVEEVYAVHKEELNELVHNLMVAEHLPQLEAQNAAYKEMMPSLIETLKSQFIKFIYMMKRMKKDKVYKKIKETIADLELNDYDLAEAQVKGLQSRDVLLKRTLAGYRPCDWLEDEEAKGEDKWIRLCN
jgi:hypothetical protein